MCAVESFPRKSTYAAIIGSWLYERKFYNTEKIETLKKFTGLSLAVVDRHDTENYPSKPRGFRDTIKIYHPGFQVTEDSTIDDVGKMMTGWLEENGLNIQEVGDWFKTNLVWEHIMGGGKESNVPPEWKMYLNVEIKDRRYGYPVEGSIWKWDQIEPEERVMAYRMVTSYYFARAMCACLGSKCIDQVAGLATIYQLASDRYHQKNLDEPLLTIVVDEIKKRTNYSDRDEAKNIARKTSVKPIVAEVAILATRLLSKFSKKAEWDSID